MRKQDVIEFFDRLAPGWDADMIKDDKIVSTILENAGIAGCQAVAAGQGSDGTTGGQQQNFFLHVLHSLHRG